MSTLALPQLSTSSISENGISMLRSISQWYREGLSLDFCESEIFSRGPKCLMKKSKLLNLLVKCHFIGQRANKTGHEHLVNCLLTIDMELQNEWISSDSISIGEIQQSREQSLDLEVNCN